MLRTIPLHTGFAAGLCLVLFAVTGAAQAAPQTLKISDNIGRAWEQEPICWEVSFGPGEWDGKDFRVLRDGNPIVAQADVAARHADNSVKTATIRFIIDKLDKDATTAITLETGVAGPKDARVWLKHGPRFQILTSEQAGIKLLAREDGKAGAESGPIVAVRLPSGKWVGSSAYATTTAQPTASKFEMLEEGPIFLRARVTTTFDNGRRHAVAAALWAGSRAIEIEEDFDVGPDTKYAFKQYKDDRDELAWEWWSWYGDKDGTKEDHPNYWVFTVNGPEFAPKQVTYYGDISTDSDKGNNKDRGRSTYQLTYGRDSRLEKYLAGTWQWRPDAVSWYAVSAADDPQADALALFTHTLRNWRNPNILPTPQGITLRTGVNDMRIRSQKDGSRLIVQCPIGLGHRCWAIRCSTVGETLAARGTSPTALDAERLQRQFGLNITRQWATDWNMTGDYPRLFIKPQEKNAYYARLKGRGIDSPGNVLDTFLRNQDQAGFDRDWQNINKQADEMLSGYFAGTGVEGYPAWMLGYWHGIVVANGLDNLLGSPLCTPQQARSLRKKLAILTYCLTSRDAWPDKQINYGWGSMNMPVGRWGGLVIMASAVSDHPMAGEWLKDAGRYFNMLLKTEYAPDGTHISCPHYIGASSTSFYAWIALANSGKFEDVGKSPVLQNFARYYMQLMKPVDPRWGIRVLLNEGDTRPGSSPFPGILASLFKKSNPDLAGQLMQIWIEGGRDTSLGMGVPDSLIIDPEVPPVKPKLGPQVFPGFGAFLRYRELGTPQEAYLAFLGGNFMIDHSNADQLAFAWNEKGVPLTDFVSDMYVPGAVTSLSHNTISWDVRDGGGADPGKDKSGNWYSDHNQPYVDLGGKTPKLHYQIGWDQQTQNIIEMRGMVTLATDAPQAALLQGKVDVKALVEYPTRPDYSVAVQPQASPPSKVLDKPFTWTRRLLYVKAATAEGMNYLVIRDDLGGFRELTPNFSYWSLSDDVAPDGNMARFKGQLGVDTDMAVLVPQQFTLHKDSFTHTNCEGIVSQRHGAKYGKPFSEKQVVCRVEGQKGQGFLVVIFPYKADEEKPKVEPWQGDAGAKVSWKGETHYVLLDTSARKVDADGIRADTSCVVVKVKDAKTFSISLPAGGEAHYGVHHLQVGAKPICVEVKDDNAVTTLGADLLGRE